MTTGEITALGRRVTEFDRFETFPAPPSLERVTLANDDFTAICPVTSQRDFYSIIASYQPNRVCLETKTWRLYLAQFANQGHFCEALANYICTDLWAALDPKDLRISLTQRVHGGTVIKAHAHLTTPQPFIRGADNGPTHRR